MILVILNRSFDLATPLLQNDTYGGQFFSTLRNLLPVLEYEKELSDEQLITIKKKLNETDPVWTNFKYLWFEDVLDQVLAKFQAFYNKHKEEVLKGDLDAMRNMPEYQEHMDVYTQHLNTLKAIKQKREELNFEQVFSIEQQVATRRY